jgi:hypothetical protein
VQKSSVSRNQLFERLSGSKRVLLAGAGGGFDVLGALPLLFALQDGVRSVHLANLTFSYMGGTGATAMAPGLYEVTASTPSTERYFPEKHLAQWLEAHGYDGRIHCFEKMGVVPMRAAYAKLCESLAPDAIVLVDGGTDILMHGDEAGLGTPAEDITSLLAVSGAPVATKLVACVGFGIDAFHGVCHAHFLENVASLTAAGAFLGAFSLLPDAPEVTAWLAAVDHVQRATPGRESIVCASIADAVRGRFGDHHSVDRTRASGTELFINPLMSLVWSFDLEAVAERCLYRGSIEGTQTIFQVHAAIEAFRAGLSLRKRRSIPA